MEFTLKNNTVVINTDKKDIILSEKNISLDGLLIELPGEYEKSGCLMYSYGKNDEQVYHFRAEGHWVAYIPTLVTDISADALEFLGNVDVLVMPGAKSMQAVMEKIEPRLLVTYGEHAHEIGLILAAGEPTAKFKLKEADLSSDKTGCVILN